MEITVHHRKRFTSQLNKIMLHLTVELHLSGRWLTGSPHIRIGLALRKFYKTNLSWNFRLSVQVQYSFIASRTSNHAWSKGLDACTYVNSNSRTSNYQRSLFSKKNPIIRISCISGRLAVPVNPNKWSSIISVSPIVIFFLSINFSFQIHH